MKRILLIGALTAIVASTQTWADLKSGLRAIDLSDYPTALRELTPLAGRGDPEAQFGLGGMYLYGWGVDKNPIEAASWYRKAAEQGHAKSQKMLGYLYEKGTGVEKNPAEAQKWYQLATRPRAISPAESQAGSPAPVSPGPPSPPFSANKGAWEIYTRQCSEGIKAGRYAQSANVCQSAMAEARRFGQNDRRLGLSVWMLAVVHHAQEHYAEAEALYKHALTIMEKSLGKNHAQLTPLLNNLADLYRVQGKREESEQLYRRALEIRNASASKSPVAAVNTPPGQPRHATGGNGTSTVIVADPRGHFFTMGSINGAPVRMMIDTGASSINLSSEEAWRIGLSYQQGKPIKLFTANGVIPGYRVMLDKVEVGNITLHQVEASVAETGPGVEQSQVVLLGMSFLNRVEMKREGSTLTLTHKD